MPTTSLQPRDLKVPLRNCGYRRDLLRTDVTIAGSTPAPLVGFGQYPADTRSACIAVLEARDNPRQVVEQAKPLGTPVVFVCFENTLQWWKQGSKSAEWMASIGRDEVPEFIKSQQDKFSPDALYRAKTWGRFRREFQLEFVDVGLMPLLEAEVGTALGRLIERNVTQLKDQLAWTSVSNKQGHWLLQSVFWLVSGKILREKGVDSFKGLSLTDVDQVFAKVADHYGSGSLELGSKHQRAALEESARSIESFASLELTTTEALAHVYENTLISKETRSSLGTHSTPSYLVDYIVGNLAEWIAEIPEIERSVFEPACGHAAFLTSAMRLLSELLPHEKKIPSRRGPYLRSRLHGTDTDSFALELARLSLTLTDIPNPDGWDLQLGDMYVGNGLQEQASKSTVLLANPPFEDFSRTQKKDYRIRDIELTHFNKASEMLWRSIPNLPRGGVFGVVLPQTFLHSESAKPIREFLLKECELKEVCMLPDKVFEASDAETAVILGRRNPATGTSVHFRRVRERDFDDFRMSYETTTFENIQQDDFLSDDRFSLRRAELPALWKYLDANPKLEDISRLGRGFEFYGQGLPKGSTTYSEEPFDGCEPGFVRFDRGLFLHDLPTEYWVNLHPSVIRRPVSGTEVGTPQILVNTARSSRGAWRLKALLDLDGHAVTTRFIPVRPMDCAYSLKALWALLNSPVANAYAFSHLSKRDNIVGVIRRIPLPISTSFKTLESIVSNYFDAAVAQANFDDLKTLLMSLDCEVLRLYGLPVELERSLLDLFADYERVGVPFEQTRYFPKGFDYPISLSEFLDMERDWDATNRQRGHLIDKDIDGSISEEEKVHLDALEAYAEFYIEKTTPRPTRELDKLEDLLFRRSEEGGAAD